MGGGPDMEFFSLGMFASVNLVLWGTALLATYIGLKLSKSTTWNPKLNVVSKKEVSAYHSMGQAFPEDDSDDDDDNVIVGGGNKDTDDLLFWK